MHSSKHLVLAGFAGGLIQAAPPYGLRQDDSVLEVNSTVEAYARRSYFYAGGQYVNASLVGNLEPSSGVRR